MRPIEISLVGFQDAYYNKGFKKLMEDGFEILLMSIKSKGELVMSNVKNSIECHLYYGFNCWYHWRKILYF